VRRPGAGVKKASGKAGTKDRKAKKVKPAKARKPKAAGKPRKAGKAPKADKAKRHRRPLADKRGKPGKGGRKAKDNLAPRPLVKSPDNAPDFFCVGAQKGGTRWLYDQLQLHPDFWMPPIKELHYFDRRRQSEKSARLGRRAEKNLARTNKRLAKRDVRPLDQRDLDFLAGYARLPWWRVDLDAYASLFSVKGASISGDITPDYSTLDARQIARIMQRFPKARVVFIARDPVERVWSHLTMHMRRGELGRKLDADAVMRLVRQRFVASRTFQTEIVARWRRYVPEEQFGLFLFDDLIADAASLRDRILSFLGGDPAKASGAFPAGFNRKEDPAKVPLSPELRDRLSRHLARELKASAAAFGGAARQWPGKYGL
jgi:hypothetical protein